MARNGQRSTQPTQSTEDTEQVDEVMQEERAAEVMRVRNFKDEHLAAIDTWEKAMSMATVVYGKVDNAADILGNGFTVIRDDDTKSKLIGASLLLLEWQQNTGDFNDFVSIYVIQRHDDGGISKWVLNGGEAMLRQLQQFEDETGRNGGMGLPKGLRKSDFHFDAEKDSPTFGKALTKNQVREYISKGLKAQPATTWYLDTSA